MRWLKLIALLSIWLFFFALVALVHLGISLFRLPGRWRIISRLARSFAVLMRGLLNIKVTLEGDGGHLGTGGQLVISNHLGYIDGFVLGSLFPLIYVSKSEVRQWPLIGQWLVLLGTIFIDRQRKEKIPHLVEEIRKKLREEANVLIFPEGTSTNGEKILPFQSAPFAAPLLAQAAILPVTLTYRRIDQEPLSETNRDRLYWYGDMEFASHLWGLLGIRCVEVSVKVHPRIETSHLQNSSRSRKELNQTCHAIIAGKPNLGDQGDLRDASPLQSASRPLMRQGGRSRPASNIPLSDD